MPTIMDDASGNVGFMPPKPHAPAPRQTTPQVSGGGGGESHTYNAPIPGAAIYGQAALAAKTAYQKALARLNSKRQTTLQQYGYTAKIDPNTGVLTNLGVDAHNPYGYYQQLLGSGAQGAEQAAEAAQERGLSSAGGLGAQGVTDAEHQFGQGSAELGTSLTQTLQGYQDIQDEDAYQRDQALYQAELLAARQAIQGGDFNPGDYSGIGDTPASQAPASAAPAPAQNDPASAAAMYALLNPQTANRKKLADLMLRTNYSNKSKKPVKGPSIFSFK